MYSYQEKDANDTLSNAQNKVVKCVLDECAESVLW